MQTRVTTKNVGDRFVRDTVYMHYTIDGFWSAHEEEYIRRKWYVG